MIISAMPIGRNPLLLAILLILAIKQSSSTSKSTATTPISQKQRFEGTLAIPSQRQLHQNDERDQEIRMSRKGLEDTNPLLFHNINLKSIRGGGNTAKSGSAPKEECLSTVAGTKIEKGSFVNRHESTRDDVVCNKTAILSIGVIDVARMESNRPDLYSSIVLVVDGDTRNDDITVDEILLQRKVLPLFQNKSKNTSNEISLDEVENDVNTILESLALLCDVLVVRIGEAEALAPDLMSCVMRGNRQRESAGMAGGKHWLSATKGPEHLLRRLTYNLDDDQNDDNRCRSSTTIWSTLFSSFKGEDENENLKELFTSFSQQAIRSKRYSLLKLADTTTKKLYFENTFGDSFPPVSVLHINKKSRHAALQDGQIKVGKTTQTPSRLIPDEIEMKKTNRQPDDDKMAGDVIRMAYQRLEELEEKMQELVLDQSSNHMPLLGFGSLVQDILQVAEIQLKKISGMHDSFRRGLTKGIVVEVQRLHKDQLQALRNYYGQRYEFILDEENENNIQSDETIERKWAVGAEHMTRAFLAAALNAVPAMYRTDLKDGKDGIKTRSEASFDHIDALQGLIQDMIESTERRKDERNVATILLANDEEDQAADNKSTSSRMYRLPKLPKWFERLAARAFVFGVNYVQGWLAWQGIKRAALERDRNQPKFPLF